MNDEFLILKYIKLYILSLDKYLENFPRKEKNLKDRILNDSYEVLELVCYTNLTKNKKEFKFKIISKINLLDFYFEKSFKKMYLSEKQFNNVTNDLTRIIKLIFGWLKDE